MNKRIRPSRCNASSIGLVIRFWRNQSQPTLKLFRNQSLMVIEIATRNLKINESEATSAGFD